MVVGEGCSMLRYWVFCEVQRAEVQDMLAGVAGFGSALDDLCGAQLALNAGVAFVGSWMDIYDTTSRYGNRMSLIGIISRLMKSWPSTEASIL